MADEKFFMEVNKNTKLENSQTNRGLVGTMWHYAWQPLNNLRTFFGWGLTKLGDGCKSLFSRATTTNRVPCEQSVNSEEYKSDKFLGLKRKSTESSRNERGNGTIQSTRQNVHKNAQTEASIQGISLDEEEFHTEINIKDNYKLVNALKGLRFSFASSQQAYNLEDSQQIAHFGESHTGGIHIEDIEMKVIKPILKNPNGEREISNKHVGFNAKVAVLKDGVKSFKEKDSSDKGRNKNEGMIRKSSYEVADELKSLKGSDLKKSFIRIGGKVIKKSKQW